MAIGYNTQEERRVPPPGSRSPLGALSTMPMFKHPTSQTRLPAPQFQPNGPTPHQPAPDDTQSFDQGGSVEDDSDTGAINTNDAPAETGSNALDAVQAALEYGRKGINGGSQQASSMPSKPAGPGGDQPNPNPFPIKNPAIPFGKQAAAIPMVPAGPGGDQPNPNPFPTKSTTPPFGKRFSEAETGDQSLEDGGPVIPVGPKLVPIEEEHSLDMNRLSTSAAKRAQAAATKKSSGTQSYATGGAIEDANGNPDEQSSEAGAPDQNNTGEPPAAPTQGEQTPLQSATTQAFDVPGPGNVNPGADRGGALDQATQVPGALAGAIGSHVTGQQPDPAAIHKYLGGDGAASKQSVEAYANSADPQHTMQPDERNLAAVQAAMTKAGPKAAFGVIQYDRKNWDHEQNLARLALTKGDLNSVVTHLNEAYHYMPDGTHISFSRNESGGVRAEVEFNAPNKKPVKGIDDTKPNASYQNVELTPEQLHDWVNIGKHGQFDAVYEKGGATVLQELAKSAGTPLPQQQGAPQGQPQGQPQRARPGQVTNPPGWQGRPQQPQPQPAPQPQGQQDQGGPRGPVKIYSDNAGANTDRGHEAYFDKGTGDQPGLTPQQRQAEQSRPQPSDRERRLNAQFPSVNQGGARAAAETALEQKDQENQVAMIKAKSPLGVQEKKNEGLTDVADIKGQYYLQKANVVEAGKTAMGRMQLDGKLAQIQANHQDKQIAANAGILREYVKAVPFGAPIPEGVAAAISENIGHSVGAAPQGPGAQGAGTAQGASGQPAAPAARQAAPPPTGANKTTGQPNLGPNRQFHDAPVGTTANGFIKGQDGKWHKAQQ